jgi:hypothetical protein
LIGVMRLVTALSAYAPLVSSSFWVRRETPADVTATVTALERAGLAWADGELASLTGPWPERPLLLYVPGASARGVEVARDGDETQIRVLASSSPGDFDLAFRLVEVLGGTSLVTVEGGEPTPADRVRARLGGEWMLREMAAGVAALRASLADGNRVTISGPVRSIVIEPGAERTMDLARVHEVLARAQIAEAETETETETETEAEAETEAETEAEAGADADAEAVKAHVAALRIEEEALGAAPAAPARRSRWWQLLPVALVFLIVLVPALAVRLVLFPVRWRVRDALGARGTRRRERAREAVVEATSAVAAAPDDVDALNRRGLAYLAAGRTAEAERDFAACEARLAAGATAEITRGGALHNRSVALHRLGLPQLGSRSAAAARAAGFQILGPTLAKRARNTGYLIGIAFAGAFAVVAGLYD